MPSTPLTGRMNLLICLFLIGGVITVASADQSRWDVALTLSKRIEVDTSLLGMTPAERRRYAVMLARSQRLSTSANILEALHRSRPSDAAVLYDLLSVLSWQEEHERVIQLSTNLVAEKAPGFALEAVARSARVSGHYDRAETWYLLALQRDPASTEATAGLILTHADSGNEEAARKLFAELPSVYRSSVDGMLMDGYLWQRQGDSLKALLSYDRVLDIEPANRAALRGKLRALRAQLLPQQALLLAAEHPGLASRDEIARLESDRAALWVRWGEVSPFSGDARFEDIDEALALLDKNARRFPKRSELALVTSFDTIVALCDRARFATAIAAYRELDLDDSDLPVYVLRAVAGAYMAQREPGEALRLYDLALLKSPGSIRLEADRFYALVELERHREAMALADILVEAEAVWLAVPGSPVIKPNPERLRAEIAMALSRAYADQLAASQSLLREMLSEAPHNTDIRQELGNLYRWRGWPRRAAFEYQQVLGVEPDLLSARIGYANTLLDLRRYEQFAGETRLLVADQPEDSGVKRLARRYELHHRREFSVSVDGGDSTGEQFGSRHYQLDMTAYLQPLKNSWRPYMSLHDSSAEFTEGDGDRRRAGLGLEYRRPGHRVIAGATTSLEGPSRAGFVLGYAWEPTDFWQVDGLLETESLAMPLRGYRIGVDATRMRLSARHRFSELAELTLAADRMDFSDGNLRSAWVLNARRRILNRPAWKLDLAASLYASSNDLTDVSYFSPSSDRAGNISLDSRWRLFRRYERSFSHRLGISAGHYAQSGFSGGFVGSIEYEQMLELSDALELYYGGRRNRALYDGNFEYGTFFFGGLRGRL